MIGLILCVVGGTDQASATISDHSTGQTYTKVGIAIFIVVYVLLFGLTVITGQDANKAPKGEKRIYIAIAAALPLIAVRLVYSIIAAFTSVEAFSTANGNPVVQLCVAVVEELIVVLMYTVAGLTASK